MQAMAPGAPPAAIARAIVAQITIRFIVISESCCRVRLSFDVGISAATWPSFFRRSRIRWFRGRSLPLHVPVEEARDLLKSFACLRCIRIDRVLRVREALKHLQIGLHAGAAQLPVGAHRQAQK